MPTYVTQKFDSTKGMPKAIWFPGGIGVYRGSPLEMLAELALDLQKQIKRKLTLPDVFKIMLRQLEQRGIIFSFDDAKDYDESELAFMLVCALLASGVAKPVPQA